MGLFNRDNSKHDDAVPDGAGLVNNLSLFQIALREGMGFAYACEVSGNDPEEVTKTMMSDERFWDSCRDLVRGANMDRLLAASAYSKEQEWDKAAEARKDAQKVFKLILWGYIGKLSEVKDTTEIFKAFVELDGDVASLAVAYSTTKKEMAEYLEKDQELMGMIKVIQKQWNDGLNSQGVKINKKK